MSLNKILFALFVLLTACNCGVESEYVVSDEVIHQGAGYNIGVQGEVVSDVANDDEVAVSTVAVTEVTSTEEVTDVIKPWHTNCCGEASNVTPAATTTTTFEYTGDLTSANLSCVNWIVETETGKVTKTVAMSEAGATQIAQVELPVGTFWCHVQGLKNGSKVYIFQPGPPTGAWQYRVGNSLSVNGVEFAHEGCYLGVSAVVHEVTVASDGNLTVANASRYWDTCRD